MQITLVIPGLTGPVARYDSGFLPRVPALDLLLSRGRCQPGAAESVAGTLSRLFGCPPKRGRDVPVAAVTHTVDAAGVGRGIWMRADPVHLRPDRRGAVLLDAASLDIDQRDALALAAGVKSVLEAEGHSLEMPCAERWYVRVSTLPELRTVALDRVVGRDVSTSMPTGADAPRWLRLLNDIQMTLHQSPVNAGREARGLPAVNSLWFWGVGETPTPVPRAWQRIHGSDLFLRGLAELSGSACLPVPGGIAECVGGPGADASVLVMLDACARPAAYQAVEQWSEAVAGLERHWFGPLPALLRSGAIRCVRLVADQVEVTVTRRDLLCLWRRGRGLARLAPGVARP